jgi:(4S)-4-hydroxy-5-phosphonooxypentane-2,3-dione isomerase
MFVQIARYRIHDRHIEAFKRRIAQHAAVSVRDEADCLQFEVSQDKDDPACFVLYEVFTSEDALAEHRKTPHVASWMRDSEGWLAERTAWRLERFVAER